MTLLLACLGSRLGDVKEGSIRAALSPELDWGRFIEMARAHCVEPLVYSVLARMPESAPKPVMESLRSGYRAGTLFTLFLIQQLLQLTQVLEDSGIPVIAFKGPLLANEIYGDIAMRAAGDLDLLVHRADIVRARDLLVSRGFIPAFPNRVPREQAYLASLTGKRLEEYIRSHAEHHLASPDGRVAVDLHWGVALKEFALPLDSEKLWPNLRTVELSGRRVKTLGVEDLLVVLCVNGAKDEWTCLGRVCDVAGLILRYPRLDWTAVSARAKSAGAVRMLLVTLALARDLLKISLPEPVAGLLDAEGAAIRLATDIQGRLFRSTPACRDGARTLGQMSFQLRLRDGLRDRARFVMAQFIPTVGEWAAFPLPAGLGALHYLIRPVRLLLERSGTMTSRN